MTDDPDRREALRTAMGLFQRFGYRKTTMDDVARELGVSRQGLYLWYPSKQALFTAVLDAWLLSLREDVDAALARVDTDPEGALLDAFDAFHGRYLEGPSATRDELFAAARPIIGDRWQALLAWWLERLAAHLPAPGHDRALLLNAASAGTKASGVDRATYRARMAFAIGLVLRG